MKVRERFEFLSQLSVQSQGPSSFPLTSPSSSPISPRMNNNTPARLHHEDLDSYQAAICFLALAARLLASFPRGYGSMADQLKRASLWVPLNLAEGYGKRAASDRARFYDIARGSAHECGALLDASKVLSLVDEQTYFEGKALLHRIVSMLVKMSA